MTNTPDLSQYHTLIRAHALINHYSKSEIFVNNALDIPKLTEDLTTYRQFSKDRNKNSEKVALCGILFPFVLAGIVAFILGFQNSMGAYTGAAIRPQATEHLQNSIQETYGVYLNDNDAYVLADRIYRDPFMDDVRQVEQKTFDTTWVENSDGNMLKVLPVQKGTNLILYVDGQPLEPLEEKD